jgi:hypothetical protein
VINGIQIEKMLKKIKKKLELNHEVFRDGERFNVVCLEHTIFFYIEFDFKENVLQLDFEYKPDEKYEETFLNSVESTIKTVYDIIVDEGLDVFFYCNVFTCFDMEKITKQNYLRNEKYYHTGDQSKKTLELLHHLPFQFDRSYQTWILQHEFPWTSHDYYAKMVLSPEPGVRLIAAKPREHSYEVEKFSDEHAVASFKTWDDYHAWIDEKNAEAAGFQLFTKRLLTLCEPYFDRVEQDKTHNQFTMLLEISGIKGWIRFEPINASIGLHYKMDAFGEIAYFDNETEAENWLSHVVKRYCQTHHKLNALVNAWLRRDPSAFIKQQNEILRYHLYSFGISHTVWIRVMSNQYQLGFANTELTYNADSEFIRTSFDTLDDLLIFLQTKIDEVVGEHRMALLYNDQFTGYIIRLQHLAGFKKFVEHNIQSKVSRKQINSELANFKDWQMPIVDGVPFSLGTLTGCLKADRIYIEEIQEISA